MIGTPGVTISDVKYSDIHCTIEFQNGTAMNFSLAVDFTASNGDPRDPRSLHFRDPTTGENQYSTAIRAVGDIIQDYDTDKQFPGKYYI